VQDLSGDTAFFLYDRVSVNRDARLRYYVANLGAGIAKTRVEVEQAGAGSDAELSGLFCAHAGGHMDMRTVQRHLADHTTSRTLFKGIALDNARTVYQGLIHVGGQAAGTDAYLSNKNLVRGEGARADSIPSLRIETNDVKCSHGSTTGRLDEDQVFYLMARGVPRKEAETMLLRAFLAEVVDRAPAQIQAELDASLRTRLQGA
jgi:Fe-S cluster assembly protein SufD